MDAVETLAKRWPDDLLEFVATAPSQYDLDHQQFAAAVLQLKSERDAARKRVEVLEGLLVEKCRAERAYRVAPDGDDADAYNAMEAAHVALDTEAERLLAGKEKG